RIPILNKNNRHNRRVVNYEKGSRISIPSFNSLPNYFRPSNTFDNFQTPKLSNGFNDEIDGIDDLGFTHLNHLFPGSNHFNENNKQSSVPTNTTVVIQAMIEIPQSNATANDKPTYPKS
ncbi:3278_t:CDS:1, partial [Cetraspora pellucida]